MIFAIGIWFGVNLGVFLALLAYRFITERIIRQNREVLLANIQALKALSTYLAGNTEVLEAVMKHKCQVTFMVDQPRQPFQGRSDLGRFN